MVIRFRVGVALFAEEEGEEAEGSATFMEAFVSLFNFSSFSQDPSFSHDAIKNATLRQMAIRLRFSFVFICMSSLVCMLIMNENILLQLRLTKCRTEFESGIVGNNQNEKQQQLPRMECQKSKL